METHEDRDWEDSLKRKAAAMRELGLSQITGGFPNEPELANWEYEGMKVTWRPDDEHNILRVSVGGSDKLGGAYCVFRGEREACYRLLRKAADAIEHCP